MTAHELMTALGFERLGPDPAQGDVILWMCSYGAQDLLVSLLETAPASDVALALYEAGSRDKRDEISARYKAFNECVRVSSVTMTWDHAREMQRVNREDRVERSSSLQPSTINSQPSTF